jgi:hypothetical protein
MEIIWELILQKLINSKRKMFYGKMAISYLIFLISMIYILIILIKVSFFLNTIIKEDFKIEMFSIYFIIAVTIIDLTVKLLFSQVKISDIYPHLRLKIHRSKLADYLIISNYFNSINIIGPLFLIPITIICMNRVGLIKIVFIVSILTALFILNNHISLILNIMRIRLFFLLIFPILLFIRLYYDKFLPAILNISMRITQIEKGITFLTLLFLIGFSYSFLRKKIIRMLYIN